MVNIEVCSMISSLRVKYVTPMKIRRLWVELYVARVMLHEVQYVALLSVQVDVGDTQGPGCPRLIHCGWQLESCRCSSHDRRTRADYRHREPELSMGSGDRTVHVGLDFWKSVCTLGAKELHRLLQISYGTLSQAFKMLQCSWRAVSSVHR
jgi:hypothetical protein